MRRLDLSSLILLGLIAGCAEATVVEKPPACSVTCSPDQVCKSDICYNTCSSNKPCDRTQQCLNNLCVARDVECAPDTRRCTADGRGVEHCADGFEYVLEKECAADMTCESGTCVPNACETDTMRCKGNNVEICKNNSYIVYTECTSPEVCMEGKFECEVPPECQTGTRRCDDNGNVQECEDEHWVHLKSCQSGYSCSSQTLDCVETAACETGRYKCNDNAVYACAEAHWQFLQKCEDGQICDGGKCQAALCTDGQQRCTEAGTLEMREVCTNNHYDSEQCMTGEVCVEREGKAVCEKNVCNEPYRCENNVLYSCIKNDVKELKRCSDSEFCDATLAECRPNCGNGIVDAGEKCDGINIPAKCSDIIPNTSGEVKCTLTCEYDASDCSQMCTPGTSYCEGSTYHSCENLHWKNIECGSDQICHPEGCYKPSFTGAWDYVQTFDSIEMYSSYSSRIEFSDGGMNWEIVARSDAEKENLGIDHNGIILKYDAYGKIYVKFSGVIKDVDRLEFDWRSWGNNNDKGYIVVLVNDKEVSKVKFEKAETTPKPLGVDVKGSMSSVEIRVAQIDAKDTSKVILDNIRWNYVK